MATSWSEVQVRVEFAPANELVTSLFAFMEKSVHATLDLGPQWAKQVRQSLSPPLAKRLGTAKMRDLVTKFPSTIIVDKCSGEKDAEGFTTWMSGMTRGEVYDFLTDFSVLDGSDLSDTVDGWHDVATLLHEWHETYFRGVSPEILKALEDDAAEKRQLAQTLSPDALIRQVAIGMDLQLDGSLDEVVLVPQYHFRPWNVWHWSDGTWFNQYPLERALDGRDLAFDQLLRMARALADESRLQLLQALAKGPARFSELVEASHVTKSTVHHHLVALRAARLVTLQTDPQQRQTLYALNSSLADDARDLLQQVLRLGRI